MYGPTSGEILVDDVGLSQFDISEWRKNVVTTFQDFARYEFRAGSTVGVGDLPNMDDDNAVSLALTRAGADDVVPKLVNGLDTPLGRSFPNGRDLSGGEWQKMALGRGRMRADPLLLSLTSRQRALMRRRNMPCSNVMSTPPATPLGVGGPSPYSYLIDFRPSEWRT
jgi:ATP-binding cassette subfamily B protein